jgi:hypothetical protein
MFLPQTNIQQHKTDCKYLNKDTNILIFGVLRCTRYDKWKMPNIFETYSHPFEAEAHLNNKDSFPTSKKIQRASMTTISWLIPFKEITAFFFGNYVKPKMQVSRLLSQVVHVVTGVF